MPAPYSAGSIFLQVVPSFRGVPEQIAREARENWVDAASDGFDAGMEKRAQETGKKMGAQISKELGKASTDAGKKAGDGYSGAFRAAMTKGIAQAQRELNTTPMKLVLNDEDLRKKVDKIRADFKSLDRQVKLGTDAGGSMIELGRLLKVIEDVQDKAKNIEVRSNLADIHRGLSGVATHIQQLSAMNIEPDLTVNDRQLSLFERKIKGALKSAMDDLPPLEFDDSEAYRQVADLRTAMMALDRDVQLGMDAGEALAELTAIQGAVRKVADEGASIDLRANAAGVFKTVAAARAEIESLSNMTIDLNVEADTDAFTRGLRSAIDGAMRDLGGSMDGGDYSIGTTVAQRAVGDLRDALESLSSKRIGVDIAASTALEELYRIRDELERIQREHWDVRLDANTAAASAQLSAFIAALEAVDHHTYSAKLEVDGVASVIAQAKAADAALGHTSETIKRLSANTNDGGNAFRAFNTRVLGVAALGPLVVPALGAIGAGILALGPLAASAGAGIGVLAFAMGGIGDAFKAMGAAQASSARDTAAYEKGVRQAAQGVSDAQRGVADAQRDASRAAEDSSRAVSKASQDVTDAQNDAARASEASARAVVDAERDVSDAREDAARAAEQAARQVESAARAVADAEDGVVQAQEDRLRAQEALTDAVRDAKEAQEDLALSLRDSRLDEVKAGLDLREAEEKLRKGIAGGASGDALLELQYNVDKYKLALDRAVERTGDLNQETEEFAKTGVEGTDKVVAARQRIADADQRVTDAQQTLGDAQRTLADAREAQSRTALDSQRKISDAELRLSDARKDQAQQALDSQRRIADAEQSLSDARRDQARQASDSQRSISDAQRQLTEAQTAYSEALAETNSKQEKVLDTMAKLGPAGQEFVKFLDGLRPKFDGLRAMAQEGILPGLTNWIDSLVTVQGPLLTSVIGGMSTAIGDMFTQFGRSIAGPAFTDLFHMLDDSGPGFIRQMGDVLTNLGEGVARLIVAMEPLSHLFGDWLVSATAKFNEWASNLKGSTGLQEFFTWVERVGPKVADFFWEFGDALKQIGIAIAPFAEGMLDGLINFLDWVSNIDPNVLGPIVIGIAGLTVALQAIFGLTALMHSFISAWNLFKVALGIGGGAGGAAGLAGTLGGVTSQVGLFAGAFAVLYTQSSLVRDVINDLVGFIGNLLGKLAGAIPNIEGVATAIGLIASSWKLGGVVGTAIGGIGTAASNAAPNVGLFAQKVTGSETAGLNAMTAMDKFGGMLGTVGKALPIAGLAFGLFAAVMEQQKRKTEEARQELFNWYEDLSKGGTKAEEAGKKLSDYRGKIEELKAAIAKAQAGPVSPTGSNSDIGDAWNTEAQQQDLEALQEDLAATEQKWRDYWNSLSPKEQRTAEVTAAQNDLATAIQNHGRYSDEAKAAAERLATADFALKQLEGDLEFAISGVNTELLKRQDIAINLAGAQMAYEQSMNALKDAHQRYLDVLADPNGTEEQSRQALESWNNQAKTTAESAAALAEAKYADLDANIAAQMGNAAMLANLEEQKRLYGDLPPALETLRQTLADTVPEPYKIATGFDQLGLAISQTPSEKGIVITSTTQEQRDLLGKLGFEVSELANHPGEFEVIPKTEAAQAALDELVKPRTIDITAQVLPGVNTPGTTPNGSVLLGSEYATGGYTGPGGKYEPAGIVHRGEFVFPQEAVNRLGVANLGRMAGLPGYSAGGLVTGLPGYADGGYVANYGGTISLSGMAVPELASFWVGALGSINSAASQAATHISTAFSNLRSALLRNFGDTHTESVGIWSSLFSDITGMATGAAGTLAGIFTGSRDHTIGRTLETHTSVSGLWQQMKDAVIARGTETRDTSNSIWAQMRDLLFGRSSETRDQQDGLFADTRNKISARSTETRDTSNTLWAQMRDLLLGRSTETRDQVNGKFGEMRDQANARSAEARDATNGRFTEMRDNGDNRAREMRDRISAHFNTLPSWLTTPINTILDKVLNNGLFKAFNSVVGALGLDGKLNIPTATQVRLATGGRVPGFSPHAKADNIPAMLTAGEWVQPVDSVQYYGADFMEAIRKKRIPREALGVQPIHRAEGGLVALGRRLQQMGARVAEHPAFPPLDMHGHGKTSLHYTGHAIDVNTRAGTSLLEQRELAPMEKLARSMGFRTIFMAPGHYNHLHIDDGGGSSIGKGLGSFSGGMLDILTDPMAALHKAVEDGLTGLETSPVLRIVGAGARKMVDLMKDKVTGFVTNLFSDGDDKFIGKSLSGNPAANEQIVKAMAAGRGWTGGEWNALRTLVMKESGFNNVAQNPTSTAFGMFQFLNSTWAGYGPKTSDPAKQAQYGLQYIGSRYGSPSRALAFHRAHNWYSEGGPVQDVDSATGAIVPDLHDMGGVLEPGLNVLMNRTGKPEAIINPQTLDALLSIADQGKGGMSPAIGTLEQNFYDSVSPRQVAGEVDHAATVARRGGKY